MKFKILAALVAAALLLASPGAGLHAKPQDARDDPLKLSVAYVLLDAQVLSKKTGLAVQGLSGSDFVLYEDGVKQHIEYLSQEKLPLSIVLLLDVSSSIAPVFGRLQAAAEKALRRLGPADEVAIMAFGGTARVVLPFSADKELAAQSIKEVNGEGLEQGTDINEGVYRAALYLKTFVAFPKRRVILAITDDVPSRVITSPAESRVFRELHENEITVCGLMFENPQGRLLIRQTPGSVRTYALETGGSLLSAEGKKLDANLGELVEHLRTRYSLGYISTNARKDGKFRKLKLELTPEARQRTGEARISVRSGYYAKPRGG